MQFSASDLLKVIQLCCCINGLIFIIPFKIHKKFNMDQWSKSPNLKITFNMDVDQKSKMDKKSKMDQMSWNPKLTKKD